MALQLGALREALLEAGASDEKAQRAAEEVATYESRLASIDKQLGVIRWMLGTNLLVTLGVLWRLLSIPIK